mmetsp:Transcript_19025/g.56604  ORF Transcript_19025/g.56604 Transcript_19025/m.56604 type:complete len:738 (-) Transcript_19025:58-2271(-)
MKTVVFAVLFSSALCCLGDRLRDAMAEHAQSMNMNTMAAVTNARKATDAWKGDVYGRIVRTVESGATDILLIEILPDDGSDPLKDQWTDFVSGLRQIFTADRVFGKWDNLVREVRMPMGERLKSTLEQCKGGTFAVVAMVPHTTHEVLTAQLEALSLRNPNIFGALRKEAAKFLKWKALQAQTRKELAAEEEARRAAEEAAELEAEAKRLKLRPAAAAKVASDLEEAERQAAKAIARGATFSFQAAKIRIMAKFNAALEMSRVDKTHSWERKEGWHEFRNPVSGEVYSGEWKDRYPHGQGKVKGSENFPECVGSWAWGKLDGEALCEEHEGEGAYAGNWSRGTKEGMGIQKLSGRRTYIGMYHNGHISPKSEGTMIHHKSGNKATRGIFDERGSYLGTKAEVTAEVNRREAEDDRREANRLAIRAARDKGKSDAAEVREKGKRDSVYWEKKGNAARARQLRSRATHDALKIEILAEFEVARVKRSIEGDQSVWSSAAGYVGERTKGGREDGQGKRTQDGNVYIGKFHYGDAHGYGFNTWADGATYAGLWQHGKMHGAGVKVDADGTVFDGRWRGGKMYGVGIQVTRDGNMTRCFYRDDVCAYDVDKSEVTVFLCAAAAIALWNLICLARVWRSARRGVSGLFTMAYWIDWFVFALVYGTFIVFTSPLVFDPMDVTYRGFTLKSRDFRGFQDDGYASYITLSALATCAIEVVLIKPLGLVYILLTHCCCSPSESKKDR